MEGSAAQSEICRALLIFGKSFGKKAIEADAQKRLMLKTSHEIALLFTNQAANDALLRLREAVQECSANQLAYTQAWIAHAGPDEASFPALEKAIKDAGAKRDDAAGNAMDVLSELVHAQYAAAVVWAMSIPDLKGVTVEDTDAWLWNEPIEES